MSVAQRFESLSLLGRIGLLCVSALLGLLAYAPFSFAYVSLVAWIPLFVALLGASVKVSTRLGFFYGVLFFGSTMGWLTQVFATKEWIVVPLVGVLAIFPAIWGLGYALLWKRFGSGWKLALWAALWWGGVEFVRAELFTLKFSWMTPGMGLGPTPLHPFIGVYGVSVVIVLAGMLLVHLRRWWIGLVALGVVMALSFLPKASEEQGKALKVLAVQAENVSFQRYQELIAECEEEVDAILLPEYVFRQDVSEHVILMAQLQRIAAQRQAVLIYGGQTDIAGGEHYNTAFVCDASGVLGTHYKNNPVHFFADGKPGEEALPVKTSLGKIGSPICFDNDYEDVVRRMASQGAEVFLVPSLDAAHWGERQHLMHCEVFRHRAAESGKWFVVAAGSGMTQVINPQGERVQSFPLMAEGWMVSEVWAKSGQTVYVQFGWLFPWGCLVLGSLAVLYALVSGRGENETD